MVTEIHVYYIVYNLICLIAFIFVIEIDYFFLSVQCFIVLLLGWGLCRSDCRSSFAYVYFSPSLFIIIFTLYRFLLLKHRRVFACDWERYRNTEWNRRIERPRDWKRPKHRWSKRARCSCIQVCIAVLMEQKGVQHINKQDEIIFSIVALWLFIVFVQHSTCRLFSMRCK